MMGQGIALIDAHRWFWPDTLGPPNDWKKLTISAFDAPETITARTGAFAIHRLGPKLASQGDTAGIHSH